MALVKRSFTLSGHRTSVALEEPFWQALEQLAVTQARSLASVVAEVDSGRAADSPLASALRVYVLQQKSRV